MLRITVRTTEARIEMTIEARHPTRDNLMLLLAAETSSSTQAS
jgi:hypothetical protein